MNRFVLLLLFLVGGLTATSNTFQNVDAKTFAALLNNDAGVVVDVRTPQEFSRGHIQGATLISMQDKQVVDKLNLLQKNKPVYVYCLSGSRSRVVANYLTKNGFTKVYNLQRGILEWQQIGYTLVQSAAATPSASKVYTSDEFGKLLNSSELVLIDFYAPWCAPCKKIAPIIDAMQQEFNGKAVIEKLDIDANPKIRTTFGVESIPGLVLFKNGAEVWRHTGLIEEQELKNIVSTYVKK